MDTSATEFATKVTHIDWTVFHEQKSELVRRYAFDPSSELKGLISFLEVFQHAAAELLGKEVVFPKGDEILTEDLAFCIRMLKDRNYVYCPYCLCDKMENDGTENSKEHIYDAHICTHCGRSFAIRYSNPVIVSGEQMSADIAGTPVRLDAIP